MFLGWKTDILVAGSRWGVRFWADKGTADDRDLRSYVGSSRGTAGTVYFLQKGGK